MDWSDRDRRIDPAMIQAVVEEGRPVPLRVVRGEKEGEL